RRLEYAFQQQDRAFPAQLAQKRGFVQVEQGEAIGVVQRGINMPDAVPIGVRLDYGPYFRARGMRAGPGQIVRNGFQMNSGTDGSGHVGLLKNDAGWIT